MLINSDSIRDDKLLVGKKLFFYRSILNILMSQGDIGAPGIRDLHVHVGQVLNRHVHEPLSLLDSHSMICKKHLVHQP